MNALAGRMLARRSSAGLIGLVLLAITVAALILQLSAALIDFLLCPGNGDVNLPSPPP